MRQIEVIGGGLAGLTAAITAAEDGARVRLTEAHADLGGRARRRQVMQGRSGALDMPGTTWRDRPAIDRGDGVFLAGDMVAAPGLLSEVAWASAIQAARGALELAGRTPALGVARS
jgi:protoporphyrinogen oxidase